MIPQRPALLSMAPSHFEMNSAGRRAVSRTPMSKMSDCGPSRHDRLGPVRDRNMGAHAAVPFLRAPSSDHAPCIDLSPLNLSIGGGSDLPGIVQLRMLTKICLPRAGPSPSRNRLMPPSSPPLVPFPVERLGFFSRQLTTRPPPTTRPSWPPTQRPHALVTLLNRSAPGTPDQHATPPHGSFIEEAI